MVCTDTEHVVMAEEAWSQVWGEFVLPYYNKSILSEEDEGAFTEGEVCYCGESWL